MSREPGWRPIVVSDNPGVRTELLDGLRSRISLNECCATGQHESISAILDLARNQEANVCLVDISGHNEVALASVRELSDHGVAVIALHTHPDPELILRCFRNGANEFLSEPFDSTSIWSALDELSKRRSRMEAGMRGSIYLVLPSKPNVGSTTIAVSLAQRSHASGCKSILLADLDPLCGSIAFHLKLQSCYGFLDAFNNWERMDEELWRNLVVSCAGLDVLVSPEAPHTCEFVAPPPGDFANLLRRYHSLAFVDCPGLWMPWYAQLAAVADNVLLVTTNEVTALHATRRSLAVLQSAGVRPEKLKLVVNRYQPETGLPPESIGSALSMPVFHTLPNDYDVVQKALLDNKPISSVSRLGKSLDVLSARLTNRPLSPKPPRAWSGLFSRTKIKTPRKSVTSIR